MLPVEGGGGQGEGVLRAGEVHQGREEEVSVALVCVRGVEVERHTVGDRDLWVVQEGEEGCPTSDDLVSRLLGTSGEKLGVDGSL